MENEPFEDVFPIEHGDFPASYVSLLEGSYETPFHSIIAFLEFFVLFSRAQLLVLPGG